MIKLKEGSKAPEFNGIDQSGREISLRDYTGKKLILFFYPKDDTPGCTDEACNLRDNYKDLLKQGFAIVGVSPDNKKSHNRFAAKFSLTFPLIADTTKKIINDYGVWGKKQMFGRNFMGVIRTTFVIDEKGIIKNIISKVETAGHAAQIINLYNQ